MTKKLFAELIGTFVLTLLGCGTAMFLGCATPAGVVGTAIAFGLTVVAMAYTIGGITGCHINPAITFAVALSGRMTWKEACIYWIGQFIGGILAGAVLLALVNIVEPTAWGDVSDTFGSISKDMMGLGCNGVANAGGAMGACLVEIIATFIFVLVVLGTTDSKLGAGNLAGLAIGLTLILVHLVCINLTGTSVNPARSFGPAIFAGGQALADVWVFIVAPM
ncbi:MAG: aquaporin, partial [Bacteroidales bacterium]|nr:aquaporin [Bacteroidales bacterium]